MVWWKCPQGHEWTTTIASRVAGSGCGVCANRVVGSDNSLAAMYPNIAKEIDFGKTDIDPASVYSKSWIGVWWNCKHGHSWKAAIRSRTEAGTGCPFCTSQTSLPEIRIFAELKELFPTAVNRQKLEGLELDVSIPELNVAIEYDGAYFHADKDAKDEEKKVAITKAGYLLIRLREKPLPCGEHDIPVEPKHEAIEKSHILEVLKIIAAKYPNTSKLQHRYSCYDEFLAEEEYQRIVSYLPGPPEEDSLAEKFPQLKSEWNYEKNDPLVPEQFHPRSGKKVWWKCALGHEWPATIDKRAAGRNCPYCSNKKLGYGNSLSEKHPEIAKLWYQPGNAPLTPKDVTAGGGNKAWWICENGHISRTRVVDKVKNNGSCIHCPGIGKNRKYVPPVFDAPDAGKED